MFSYEVVLCFHPYRGNPYKHGALIVVFQYCTTVGVGVACTQWLCLPTKWFCVIIHIGHCGCECCVQVAVMSAHEVVLCFHPYRGNPYKHGALTVVFQFCTTVGVGVACTQWFCLPTKWFCVIIHIGETLINMGR